MKYFQSLDIKYELIQSNLIKQRKLKPKVVHKAYH